ncbi:MAG: T9SS type A sorting domain-containing protein [Calditrichia bacterium]
MKCFSIMCVMLFALNLNLSAQIQDQWVSKLRGLNTDCIALNPIDHSVVYTLKGDTFMVSKDSGENWQNRGILPFGRRKSMSVSPADTSIILLHSNELYRSADGGYTWTQVLQQISMNGETLAFDPINPQIAYIAEFLTGDFYVSEDAGETWAVRSNLGTPIACSIAPHPTISGLIIAGAGSGRITRTIDGGFTWTMARQEDGYTLETPKVEWDPANPALGYASTFSGVYSCFRTVDFGETWINAGPLDIGMWGMQPNPVNGNVYIGTLAASSNEQGLWASYDHGMSFQQVGAGGLPAFVYVKMIKVAKDSSVYVLNDNTLYRVDQQPYGTIAGSVLDSSGVRPLLLAEIRVNLTGDVLSVNNTTGSYEMHLPAGTYTLNVETPGASVVQVTNVQVIEGQTTSLDVIMPINRRLVSLQGSVSTDVPFPLVGDARIYYKNEVGFRINENVSLGVSGAFQFDSLSSLNQFDSLVITPETLPLLPYVVQNVSVDSNYAIALERADVLVSAINKSSAGSAIANLKRNNIQSRFQQREGDTRSYSPEILEYTKTNSLIWIGANDDSSMTSAVLDSLEKSVQKGHHLLFSGQDVVENNFDAPFFNSTLQIIYDGDYVGTNPLVRGFQNNPLTSDLIFAVSAAQQPSKDRMRSTHPESSYLFSYGNVPDDTLEVGGINFDDSGFGGRVVIVGYELQASPDNIADSLFGRFSSYLQSGPVGIYSPSEHVVSESMHLDQNYPNPFNPSTKIDFFLPSAAQVDLTVYDMLGRQVRSIVNGVQQAGQNSVVWDGRSDFGELVASGIYFYRLHTVPRASSEQLLSRKMLLLR